MSLIDCNNDNSFNGLGTGRQSAVAFKALPGSTYYFQVGGPRAAGPLEVRVQEVTSVWPSEDDWLLSYSMNSGTPTNSIWTIDGSNFSMSLMTAIATLEVDEPQPCGGIAATLWYEFVPSDSRDLVFEVSTSSQTSFRPAVAVYQQTATGSGFASLTNLGCKAATGPGTISITAAGVPGAKYLIQVGGFEGDTGDFVLKVKALQPLP